MQALLANGATFHSVNSFLRDPSLNLPEAKNFQTLLSHPWASKISQEAYETLLVTLKQAITLGSVLHTEVELVLPRLKAMIGEIFGETETQFALLRMYWSLWEGLKTCRLMQIPPSLVTQLMKEAHALRETHNPAAELVLDLCKFAWPIPEVEKATIGTYLSHWECVKPTGGQSTLSACLAFWARCAHQTSLESASNSADALDRSTLIKILKILPTEGFLGLVTNATRRVAARINNSSQDRASWVETLIFWLDCVRQMTSRGPSEAPTGIYGSYSTMYNLYRLLSANLPMEALLPALKSLPPLQVCRMLVEVRIPGLIRADERMYQDLKTHFHAHLDANTSRWNDDMAIFAALVRGVQETISPYDRRVMSEVFELVFEVYGAEAFHRFLKFSLDSRVVISPQAVEAILKRTNIINDNPKLAFAIWRLRKVWISRCPELIISMIRSTTIHSDRIFTMLNLKEPANSVPYRQRSFGTNPLDQGRIDLIHHMALCFAERTCKTSRVTFRDVHLCYLYLRHRSVELQPSMSRALVLSGAIRPLLERRYVNAERCRWILALVRKLEGREVAEELDRMIYRWRAKIRHELHQRGEWKDNREDIPKPSSSSGVWTPHKRSGSTLQKYRNLPKWYRDAISAAKKNITMHDVDPIVNEQPDVHQVSMSQHNQESGAEAPGRSWDWSTESRESSLQLSESQGKATRLKTQPKRTWDWSKEQMESPAHWPLKELIKGEIERKKVREAQQKTELQSTACSVS